MINNNSSLRSKLIIGFSIPVGAIVALTLLVFYSVNALLEANRWVDHTHREIAQGKAVLSVMVDMETSIRGYLVTGKPEFLQPYYSADKTFEKIISSLQHSVGDNSDQVTRLQDIVSMKQQWIKVAVEPEIAARKAMNNVTLDDITALIETGVGQQKVDAIREQIRQFVEVEQALIVTRSEQAQDVAELTYSLIVICTLVAAAVIAFIAYRIISSVERQVGGEPGHMADVTRQIADGDLTISLKNTGKETGIYAAMRDMTERLKLMLEKITLSANEQAAATESLAAISQQTDENVQQQHQATDQVATAVEEMQATATEVAHNTGYAADSANQAGKLVDLGNQKAEQVASDISRLSVSLGDTTEVIQKLSESASRISNILDVIKGIAEQTNLLALNAAIEAARAGDQGRGFAVVADEVRSLAQNTQNSTSEIESMIIQLQQGATASVESMSVGRRQAEQIVVQTSEVTGALTEIKSAVHHITDMTGQIANAANEQKATTGEINRRILDIRTLSQQTGDGTKEISLSATQLADLNRQLNDEVAQFKVI